MTRLDVPPRTPLDDLREAWPQAQWEWEQRPDRDGLVIAATVGGRTASRVIGWNASFDDAVLEILFEVGLLEVPVLAPVRFEERSPAVLYAPVHGGYPYARFDLDPQTRAVLG